MGLIRQGMQAGYKIYILVDILDLMDICIRYHACQLKKKKNYLKF